MRWLMLPVAWVLLASNLSLPQRAYTGISLQPDGRIGSVDPGSPGESAGLVPGDRLRSPGGGRAEQVLSPGPLAHAAPGTPLVVLRERAGAERAVWLVPRPLPDAERRFLAVLFAVASSFALLGGWIWMERRDRLTRTFYLLCLAFTVLLAPPPRFHAAPAALAYELLTVLAQLFAGPLFSHFFALFPESGRPRARGWVLAGYAVATVLLAVYLGVKLGLAFGAGGMGPLLTLLQAAPALSFAAGLLGGLVLFALAFARAETSDARRRLRVAFIGTLLGALPFAVLVGLRNLSSAPVIPGERWAVLTLLLVPLSFGWAMAVHNVFDFRVALRAFTRAAGALIGAGVLYVAGEWAAAAWWPAAGPGAVGSALAVLALLAALAGPARGWLGAAGQRLVPIEDEASLADWSPAGEDEPQLLHAGCDAVVRALRVDGCCALRLDAGGAVLARAGALLAPALSPAAPEALRHASGPLAPAELKLAHEDRDALEQTGTRWLLPVNEHMALAIGRRFAGAWLSRAEARALERLARLLAVGLENLELRREARGHEGLAREMREASAVQARRLPRRTPVFPTLDCAASTLATEAVGGDYYDFVETGGREFTLAVGDAAGHGVPAALVLAGVQARFRDEARRASHPAELLEAMNRDLVALEQPEKFMGLLCARVDAGSGLVRFANAGLTPPLLRRRDGRREPLTESGLLLGVQDGASYAHTQSELEPGDVLVVYTDGLSEAPREGEPFGEERLWDVLDRHAHRRAADVLEELMNAVRNWADGPLDDLTIVVLKQLARSRGNPPTRS
jgi:serine phosphatase RsbU (regulator of sigma subunit)